MNLLRAAEFKVGMLVLIVSLLIAYMSMQVSSNPSYMGRSNEAWFLVTDANGLVKGSAIKSAGIPIGIIKDIKLQDGQARVDLTLRPDFVLHSSATIEIRSQGILGDKLVALSPGVLTDPPLANGGQILNVKDKGSLDNLVSKVTEIADSLGGTAKVLQESVSEDGTKKHILGRIISNIETISEDLADITSENKGKISSSMSRLDSTLKNIDGIAAKINSGEGTLGKLVHDDETIEGVNTAVDGINSFLDGANKTETALDFHTEYLTNIGSAKTTVGLKIQPGVDRYYYIGIVDDPAGVVETTNTKLTQGGSNYTYSEEKTYQNKVKFNLLFAKTFYNLTVKGGLIENSGGLGAEYLFYKEKFKFSIDMFEFSNLNLRAQLQYNMWKGLYFNAGVSDAFNKQSKYSNYLGVGLLLTNDDLKMLMTKLPLM